jgi:hypothetical protein
MNPIISAIPKGWLGFFGLKEQGKNPATFGDALSAGVVMNGFYQAGDEIAQFQDFGAIGPGTFILGGPIVPQARGWWLSFAAVNCVTPAGHYGEVQIAVAPSDVIGNNVTMAIGDKAYTSPAEVARAGIAISSFCDYQNPIFLPPGSQIVPCATIIGAVGVGVRLFLKYREVFI